MATYALNMTKKLLNGKQCSMQKAISLLAFITLIDVILLSKPHHTFWERTLVIEFSSYF